MIRALKALLGGPAPQPAPDLGPREAAAALMVETAQADGIYEDGERDHILYALRAAFGLSAAEADALLGKAEALAGAAVDHYRFTRVVKEKMEAEEREALMEQLWRIALAGGRPDPAEESFLRRIAPLLAVNDRARILARKRAEADPIPAQAPGPGSDRPGGAD